MALRGTPERREESVGLEDSSHPMELDRPTRVGNKNKMTPDLSEFVSAGFIITRLITRPSYVSADLLPEHFVSASGCISSFVPDAWCIEWTVDTQESRLEEARKFALDGEALSKLTAWVTPQFDTSFRWPNVVLNLDLAHQLVEAYLGGLPDVRVLELALHKSMTERFCREAEPRQQPDFAPIGRQGVHDAILEGRSPAEGGRSLGFEPLVFDHALSCSWLCNSLDTPVAKHLGIRPNCCGMIDQFDDACRCVEYISSDEVGAEPGLWLPWLIMEHPAKAP